jgi:arsenate reductase
VAHGPGLKSGDCRCAGPAFLPQQAVTTPAAERHNNSDQLNQLLQQPRYNNGAIMQILFLCTANSCRSILAEAIFNHMAPEGMRAHSAGSQPKGQVHPQSLRALQRNGISSAGLHSKAHAVHEQLRPDLVITLCDSAAAEPCPAYFGDAIRAHWGLPDPDGRGSTPAEVDVIFDDTVAGIQDRIEALLALSARPQPLCIAAVQALADLAGSPAGCT